jgi:hypothetical protein
MSRFRSANRLFHAVKHYEPRGAKGFTSLKQLLCNMTVCKETPRFFVGASVASLVVEGGDD